MIQLRNMNKRKARFEGWYFKHQNAHHTVAFIPGYHVDEIERKCLKVLSISSQRAM